MFFLSFLGVVEVFADFLGIGYRVGVEVCAGYIGQQVGILLAACLGLFEVVLGSCLIALQKLEGAETYVVLAILRVDL